MQSALGVEEILEMVLQKLNMKQIAHCRLVSKKWNTEACRILNRRVVYEFRNKSDLEKFTETFQLLKPLISTENQLSLLPQNYKFHLQSRPHDDSILTFTFTELQNFIKVPQPNVKSLTVRTVGDALSVEPIVQMIYNSFPNLECLNITIGRNLITQSSGLENCEDKTLPKLKAIKITIRDIGEDSLQEAPEDRVTMLTLLVRALLGSAINLKSLAIKGWYLFPSLAAKLVNTISNLRSPHLHELDIDCYSVMSGEIVRAISTNLHCQRLEVLNLSSIDPIMVKPSVFNKLFSSYAPSLRRLELKFTKHFEKSFPGDAPLSQLCHLTLNNFTGSINWNKLPELKRVELMQSSLEGIVSPTLYSCAGCSLESLDISLPLNTEEEFNSLFSRVAPVIGLTLTTLRLRHLGFNLPLQIIFSKLKKLQLLELEDHNQIFSSDDMCGTRDKTLLHISWPDENSPADEMAYLDRVYQSLVNEVKQSKVIREYPYIGDLKDLRYLQLRGKFSENVVLHGIIHCKKIRELELLSFSQNMSQWTDRVTHIIHNADLQHLRSAAVNGVRISHLPRHCVASHV